MTIARAATVRVPARDTARPGRCVCCPGLRGPGKDQRITISKASWKGPTSTTLVGSLAHRRRYGRAARRSRPPLIAGRWRCRRADCPALLSGRAATEGSGLRPVRREQCRFRPGHDLVLSVLGAPPCISGQYCTTIALTDTRGGDCISSVAKWQGAAATDRTTT